MTSFLTFSSLVASLRALVRKSRVTGRGTVRIQVASLVIATAVLTMVSARANDSVFVVPRVPVSAQAESAIAAKQVAEIEGRRQAMDLLLRRLTPREDWGYLPRLAQQQAAPKSEGFEAIENPYNADPYESGTLPDGQLPASQALGSIRGKQAIALEDDQLRRLEQSFEVYEEKSGPTTYRAFITYRFKPDEARNLLINAGIPYSETQTRIALVLPVLETDRGLYLWEQNNPWLKAWQSRPLAHELTPMTAPLGDLEDSAGLSAQEAMALDQEKLAALAERYGVSQVIIAHARLSQADGNDKVRVRLINGLRESGSLDADEDLYSAGEALDGLADRTGQRLLENNDAQLPLISNGPDALQLREPGDVLAESWITEPSGNFPAVADKAIIASVTQYSSDWKSQTLIDHSQATVLRATAFFRSLSEWKRIRTALISTPLVGSVQIRNLSREGAEMSIQSFGEPGKLVVAMENQGVSLWTFSDGPVSEIVWNIATPATASRIPAHIQRAPEQRRRRVGSYSDEAYGEGNYNDPYADTNELYDIDPVTGNPIRRVNDETISPSQFEVAPPQTPYR